jgi:hypothetical protein
MNRCTRQMNFGIARHHGYTYNFHLNFIMFLQFLNTAMVRNFEVMLG